MGCVFNSTKPFVYTICYIYKIDLTAADLLLIRTYTVHIITHA